MSVANPSPNGYLASLTDPLDLAINLTHTSSGLLMMLTGAKGKAHVFTYDENGFFAWTLFPSYAISKQR